MHGGYDTCACNIIRLLLGVVGGMVVMVGGARLNFGEELGDDGVVERGAGVGG